MPWMGLSPAPFSSDASWHSVCVVLIIVAVQLASNISLESVIDQGNPKPKLLRLAVPVEPTNCPKTVCSCGETRILWLSMDWTELPPSSKGDCEYNSILIIVNGQTEMAIFISLGCSRSSRVTVQRTRVPITLKGYRRRTSATITKLHHSRVQSAPDYPALPCSRSCEASRPTYSNLKRLTIQRRY